MSTAHIGTTHAIAWIAAPGDVVGEDTLTHHALVIGDADDRLIVEGELPFLLSLTDRIQQFANQFRADQETTEYTVNGLVDDNGALLVAGVFLGDQPCRDEDFESGGLWRYCTSVIAANAADAEAMAITECARDNGAES